MQVNIIKPMIYIPESSKIILSPLAKQYHGYIWMFYAQAAREYYGIDENDLKPNHVWRCMDETNIAHFLEEDEYSYEMRNRASLYLFGCTIGQENNNPDIIHRQPENKEDWELAWLSLWRIMRSRDKVTSKK